MEKKFFEKGDIKWDSDSILNELDNFISIYEKRPIKNNKGGMQFSSMFYFYFILKNKKPSFVIESGVYKGQSTWLIENTLPESEILSIDIDLNQREYFSKKANYSNLDFKFQDLSKIPNDTLVFFDDHVNHLERIIESNFFKIKNIVLEDNYSLENGDFQTIKQLYNNHTFKHNPGFLSLLKSSLIFNSLIIKKIFQGNFSIKKDLDQLTKRIRDGYEKINFNNIEKNISLYYEFPPLINDNKNLLEKKPLLDKHDYISDTNNYQFVNSNFFTYLELL
tara:strand:- start:1866 stop:2699 length:834 start_codon:yes stop_codon:yes gene_type:complete